MDGIGGGGGAWFGGGDVPVHGFGRERRMHVRAYDYWVSLLRGRRMPKLDDLDPDRLGGFADNSVLIDLSGESGAPAIAFLGEGLRVQAGIAAARPVPDQVPRDSLLAALLARFTDIVARRAALEFEAELGGAGDVRILHRGILLPFAGDDGALGAIYGVVSWKELAAVAGVPDIVAAIDSVRTLRPDAAPARLWGDGPGPAGADPLAPQPLDQRLAAARTWAALATTDRTRRSGSLHAALGAAHDLLIGARAAPAAFALLAGGARPTSMTVIALVFGAETPRGDRRRHAWVLDHAARIGIGAGGLAPLLERTDGGQATLVAAERRARRLARGGAREAAGRAWLAEQPAIGHLALGPVDDDFLLLVGRRAGPGVDVVAHVPPDDGVTGLALGRFATG